MQCGCRTVNVMQPCNVIVIQLYSMMMTENGTVIAIWLYRYTAVPVWEKESRWHVQSVLGYIEVRVGDVGFLVTCSDILSVLWVSLKAMLFEALEYYERVLTMSCRISWTLHIREWAGLWESQCDCMDTITNALKFASSILVMFQPPVSRWNTVLAWLHKYICYVYVHIRLYTR